MTEKEESEGKRGGEGKGEEEQRALQSSAPMNNHVWKNSRI